MSAIGRYADRLLTIGAICSVPAIIAGLWHVGAGVQQQFRDRGAVHERRGLIDSIVRNASSRIVWGSPRSHHTIVEVLDYQCPSCRLADSLIRISFSEKVDERILAINFPIESIHPLARAAATAAICAEHQRHLREYHDALFKRRLPLDGDSLWLVARNAGVADPVAFASCRANPATQLTIAHDVALAQRLGARGTPTFIDEDGRLLPLSLVLQKMRQVPGE